MAIFALNCNDETKDLIQENLVNNDEIVKFSLQTKLNLSDKTTLIRLALINLFKNIPDSDEVTQYKAALLRPHEFDDFLKDYLKKQSEESIVT